MEIWTDNITDYQRAVENGDIIEVAVNFDDNKQGLYIPTYVIKGDPTRGIEPLAPNLKTVKDLPQHWELFKDQEDPSKGRIYGSIPGWQADVMLSNKVKVYGLDKYYNYFSPGSDTALATSLVSAYEKGEPWVGYYWDPTWITGKYDLTLLADEAYSDEKWQDNYQCEFPSQRVTIAVTKGLPEQAADVVEFLKEYQTSSEIISKALAYMQDNNASTEQAAVWFLQEYEELWTQWVSPEVADQVKSVL
jgi:glycine betaine/proline transport system substrate-binding protein